MAESREIRWKIDAYTRETMPLDRLVEYLSAFAAMLGESPHVHLVRIDTSSTVPILKVDDEAAQRVRTRATEIRLGTAPPEAMRSYREINRMLREDHGTAVLCEDTSEILPFPGKAVPPEALTGIQQPGNLDGELQKVGGPNMWVPIHLKLRDETSLTGCYAKRSLAKELGHHLFESIRLYGRGRWNRSPEGDWRLDKFYVDSFDPLDDQPLPSVVATLRAVSVRWPKDPIAALEALRHGTGEHD